MAIHYEFDTADNIQGGYRIQGERYSFTNISEGATGRVRCERKYFWGDPRRTSKTHPSTPTALTENLSIGLKLLEKRDRICPWQSGSENERPRRGGGILELRKMVNDADADESRRRLAQKLIIAKTQDCRRTISTASHCDRFQQGGNDQIARKCAEYRGFHDSEKPLRVDGRFAHTLDQKSGLMGDGCL